MSECANCGAELGSEDKFCGECGSTVDPQVNNLTSTEDEPKSKRNSNEILAQTTDVDIPITSEFSLKATVIMFLLFSISLMLLFGALQYFYVHNSEFYQLLKKIEEPGRYGGLSNFNLYIDPTLMAIVAVFSLWISAMLTNQKLAGFGLVWLFFMLLIVSYFYKLFEYHLLVPLIGWNTSYVPVNFYSNSFFEVQYNHFIFSALLCIGIYATLKFNAIKKYLLNNRSADE